MTTKEKIQVLSGTIITKKRDDGTTFHCFSDETPKELKNLFLENYNVKDVDYETFGEACAIMSEIYSDYIEENKEHNEALAKSEIIDDQIYEQATDRASYYTATLLTYIDIWNQDEITEHVKDLGVDIATAAAVWYDKQVEQMCFIIKTWLETN